MIKSYLRLPNMIEFEGICFTPTIFVNNSREVKLCYQYLWVEKTSPHYKQYTKYGSFENKLLGNSNCSYLYLYENIDRDSHLREAIEDCYQFLKKNNLL